ncbi:MAG: hypothetical protein QXU99_02725 [Candidatus Bathyarchaeia archaeon]
MEKFELIAKEINNFVKFVYELAPTIKATPFALAVPFDVGGIVDAAVKLGYRQEGARRKPKENNRNNIDAPSWKNFKDI